MEHFENKSLKLDPWMRIVLVICGLMMGVAIFVPMWRIELVAPQYPEGLVLLIYPNKLAGNVDIINGLNHYIGMQTLHTEDFFEFKVLPYLIGFFAISFMAVGIVGRRSLLWGLLTLFIAFGVLAMYDFWRWEYNYGHNLNPDAAIIVPGMAYQPPLIGFKQLLNFGAYSLPDLGGWITIFCGLVLLTIALLFLKKQRKVSASKPVVILAGILMVVSSCSSSPEPILVGVEPCHYCKMLISNPRFGSELVSNKSKVFKFDDVQCMLLFLKEGTLLENEIHSMYITHYLGAYELLPLPGAALLSADQLKSPMGGNIAAFKELDSLKAYQTRFGGQQVSWEKIKKP